MTRLLAGTWSPLLLAGVAISAAFWGYGHGWAPQSIEALSLFAMVMIFDGQVTRFFFALAGHEHARRTFTTQPWCSVRLAAAAAVGLFDLLMGPMSQMQGWALTLLWSAMAAWALLALVVLVRCLRAERVS